MSSSLPIPDHPSRSRIIKLCEVMNRTGYSKSKIYRDMGVAKFPKQAKRLEGSTSAGWFEDDIDAFIATLRVESNFSSQCIAQSDPVKSPKPQINGVGEGQTLIRTGMKLYGADVFCHLPTRKLLVLVGSISDECLSALQMAIGQNPSAVGGNLRS